MPTTSESSTRIVVRCPRCGTKNRVDRRKALATVAHCARCHTPLELPEPQDGPLMVRDADFERVVERSPVPVLLEFWSPYCLYCQKFEPVLRTLTQEASDRMRFARLDIDQNKATQARFGVTGTPTLLVLDRGRELDRIVGALGEDQLRYRLHRFLHPA